jgi:hypothetical protein
MNTFKNMRTGRLHALCVGSFVVALMLGLFYPVWLGVSYVSLVGAIVIPDENHMWVDTVSKLADDEIKELVKNKLKEFLK